MENKSLVSSLISGTGILIIAVIVVLLFVSTLLGANLLRSTATTSYTYSEHGYLNNSGWTLSNFVSDGRAYTIVWIGNGTSNKTIVSANYTFNSATGVLKNATPMVWQEDVDGININYTYILPTDYESTTTGAAHNFTSGIDNVSEKIPTILLIGAIVLLLGVLVMLVRYVKDTGYISSGTGSL